MLGGSAGLYNPAEVLRMTVSKEAPDPEGRGYVATLRPASIDRDRYWPMHDNMGSR